MILSICCILYLILIIFLVFNKNLCHGHNFGGGGGGGGGAVAWLLTPQTPDPEVGGSSPTRVAVLCP